MALAAAHVGKLVVGHESGNLDEDAAMVEEKFAALAEGVLSERAQQKLKDAIWNLEKMGSVSKLMALMKADVRAKKLAPRKSTSKKKRS